MAFANCCDHPLVVTKKRLCIVPDFRNADSDAHCEFNIFHLSVQPRSKGARGNLNSTYVSPRTKIHSFSLSQRKYTAFDNSVLKPSSALFVMRGFSPLLHATLLYRGNVEKRPMF